MNVKNIIKVVALAMLMPAMLLNSACSNEDEPIFENENAPSRGYPLYVSVNATRQGDEATTRAEYTYNETTKKGTLAFTAGDKLFVTGQHVGDPSNHFAGLLDYDAVSGKFSGTIYTQYGYSGTPEELFEATMTSVNAYLFPAGYESLDFITKTGSIPSYNDIIPYGYPAYNKAFALTKAAAVEQFSYEYGYYDKTEKRFVLTPHSAILNFTINGLAASTNVTATLTDGSSLTISGEVTTNASGTATFAMGVAGSTDLNELSLTVAGKAVTLVSISKVLDAGKIYNIARSAPAATSLSELKTAINGGTDCSRYIGWEVNSAGAIAESGISGTKIGYVALVSTSDVDAGVIGSRILVIASADAAANTSWGSSGTARGLTADDLNGYSNTNTLQGYGSGAHPAAHAAWNYDATIPSGAHWFMPTKKQWENMRDAKGGTYGAMSTAYGISGHYWTSTEVSNNNAWRFVTNSKIQSNMKSTNYNVRSIFAY